MKKICLFLIGLLVLPMIVFADAGASGIDYYEIVVTNSNGAKSIVYNEKIKRMKISQYLLILY